MYGYLLKAPRRGTSNGELEKTALELPTITPTYQVINKFYVQVFLLILNYVLNSNNNSYLRRLLTPSYLWGLKGK